MMKIFLVDSDIECKSRTSSVYKNASSSEFSVAVVVLSELQSFSEYLTIVISSSTGAVPFSCLPAFCLLMVKSLSLFSLALSYGAVALLPCLLSIY